MIRIAMFSGPRNISTTLMRAFENRPDTVVFDEPFYACYLKESGAPHPMREEIMAAMSADRREVAAQLTAPPRAGASISFEKHIAFHFANGAPLDWLDGARIVHLIRDPQAMIASYRNKYDDAAPIIDSLKVQRRLYEDAEARGASSPVVASEDIQRNPAGVLGALCAALDIPFTDRMLSWPAGPRDSDGVWAAHWYDAVLSSTGFRPYREKEIDLPAELEAFAEACRPDYEFFHSRRLRAPTR